MFSHPCTQAQILQDHGCSDAGFSDFHHFSPPFLKNDTNYDANSDDNLLRARYRRWCQDYSLPHQNSSYFSINQASGFNSLQDLNHSKCVSELNARSIDESSFASTDVHTPSTHPLHFSSGAQTDSDIWDVLFQGNDRKASFSDLEKSNIFSSATESNNSSLKHRNFSGFSDDEVQAIDSPPQPTAATYNSSNIHKVKCSSSNNNNNANYGNSFGSEVFLSEPNQLDQEDSKQNFSLNSQSSCAQEHFKKNIKTEISNAHPLQNFEELQNRKNEGAEMMNCQEFSTLEVTDAAKVSSQMSLPPISLLSGRRTSGKSEDGILSSVPSSSINSQSSYSPIEDMKTDDFHNESKNSEDFSPVFHDPDSSNASNFCLYGQRAQSQNYIERNDIFKNICKSR